MKLFRILSLLAIILASGCAPGTRYVSNAPPAIEVPVVNLPKTLRQRNWTSRTPRKYGQGSCVHASTIMAMNWQNETSLANKWRSSYSGGETASSILAKYRSNGVPYCALSSYDVSDSNPERFGNPDFLEWASRTRRGAIVWFKPSHCCFFVGFSRIDDKDFAVIIDNNRIDKFEYYDKLEFIRRWRSYGGFAATPMISPPAPPLPWQSYKPATSKGS